MTNDTTSRPEGYRGLCCRACGCQHLKVIYTRARLGGKLVRRRECRHCGQRLTTWEQPIGYTTTSRDTETS